jgi:branched-chain amino acid transport system permease protein
VKPDIFLGYPLVKLGTFLVLLFGLLGGNMLGGFSAAADELQDEKVAEYYVLGNVKLEGVPLQGVDITVAGPDFSETVTTGEDGKWSVRVPEKNIYSVTLDESTLPEGIAVIDGGAQQEVEFGLTDNAVRNFFIGEGQRNEVGFAGQLFSRIIYGLNFGLMLALAAVGLSLIYGTTKLSNFAHAEFVTFGAIAVLFFSFALQMPTALAILFGVLASAGLGWLSDAGLWKPLRKRGLGLVPLMIVSIGLALTLRYIYQFFIGGGTIQLPGAQSQTFPLFGTLSLSLNSIISMVVSIVVLLTLSWWLLKTQMGKATRAISDNSDLASVAGIDTEKVIRVVWILAGGLAGLGGILWAYFRPGVKWDMGEKILLLMFAAVILGGLGTAFGALVGSLVVGMLMEVSALFIPDDLKYVGALAILIATLLIKPSGIFGRKERVG